MHIYTRRVNHEDVEAGLYVEVILFDIENENPTTTIFCPCPLYGLFCLYTLI